MLTRALANNAQRAQKGKNNNRKPVSKNNSKSSGKGSQPRIVGVPIGINPPPTHPPMMISTTSVQISECTEGFAYAQLNAFDAFDKGNPVCMPDTVVLPTQKNRYKLKGNGSTGTTGIGHIIASAYAPAYDGTAVSSTQANSVGTLSTGFNLFTNLQSIPFPTSPYSIAQFFAGDVEFRSCAFAVRVMFKGTVLNAGGSVYAYRTPSNTDLQALTPSDIIPLDQCVQYPLIANEWTTVHWKVAKPDDLDFGTAIPPQYQMCLIVVSATGTPQPFNFEAVYFNEVVGAQAAGKTISHSDPVGFGAVQALTTRVKDSYRGNGPSKKRISNSVASVIKESTSYVKEVPKLIQSAKAGYNMVSGLLGNGSKSSSAGMIRGSGPIVEFLEDTPEAMSLIAV